MTAPTSNGNNPQRSAFFSRLRDAVAQTLNEQGEKLTDQLRQDLATPFPPASSPGEEPHRRSGELAAGIGHHIEAAPGGVRLVVHSARPPGADDANVPAALEFGGANNEPRPYMMPSLTAAPSTVTPALAEAVRAAK